MRIPCGAILVAMALAAHGGADVRAADRTVCFNEAVAYPPVDVWRGMLKPGTRINVAVGSLVFQRFEDWPRDAALALRWRVPVEVLKSGDNAVEILPPAAAPGNVVWCALRLAPPRKVGERFEKETK